MSERSQVQRLEGPKSHVGKVEGPMPKRSKVQSWKVKGPAAEEPSATGLVHHVGGQGTMSNVDAHGQGSWVQCLGLVKRSREG